MNDAERYETIDLPFYREQVASVLPPTVLDFHVHLWRREDWKVRPWETDAQGGKYMVVETEYVAERLDQDARRIFPDREYQAVCFGNPTPSVNLDSNNSYVSRVRRQDRFPLLVAGWGTHPREELKRRVIEGGFYGFKVLLNWVGDDYGQVTIPDMIGPDEMTVANDLCLVVLLHVPRRHRLVDPVVQEGVVDLSRRWPQAQIVLAHCGRCYLPDEMFEAVKVLKELGNVHLDTSMVMDPTVLEILLDHVDSHRILFATDLPVAAMRGRRVYAMDHWVDVVAEGYPPSAYRVASDGIRTTFMVWEIILAIRRAAERMGLDKTSLQDVFFQNGMDVLKRVRSQHRDSVS